MAKKEYLQRYILIIELLRFKESTFKEIKNKLFEHDIYISQRTFQRDKTDIESLWGIEIKFNKKIDLYEINEEHADDNFNRILESFNLVNILNKGNSVSEHVFLEQQKPKGTELFKDIIFGIQNKLVIKFQHDNFKNEQKMRTCVPKAIKEAKNRWYLIGYDLERNEFRNFGLDRISNLSTTSIKKNVPNIDIDKLYLNSFGIETYGKVENIVIECTNFQAKYFKSLPLHHSQTVILENKQNTFFSYKICVTNDFTMELLKYSDNIKVTKPYYLQEEIKNRLKRTLELYK